MLVMCLNYSGNNGKSTLTDNAYAPRMPNVEIIRIETINAHEGEAENNLKGKEFGQVLDGTALFENAIVDVGSSNVQDLMVLLKQYAGSHELFDYFVVPVVPHPKQIRDTISTIEALADIGVEPSKIRLVFNMVEDEDVNLQKEFAPLYDYYNKEHKFTLNPRAVVYRNDFYSRIAGKGVTIEAILADKTDYAAALKAAQSPEEKIEIAQKRSLKFLANGLKVKLDDTFAATFE